MLASTGTSRRRGRHRGHPPSPSGPFWWAQRLSRTLTRRPPGEQDRHVVDLRAAGPFRQRGQIRHRVPAVGDETQVRHARADLAACRYHQVPAEERATAWPRPVRGSRCPADAVPAGEPGRERPRHADTPTPLATACARPTRRCSRASAAQSSRPATAAGSADAVPIATRRGGTALAGSRSRTAARSRRRPASAPVRVERMPRPHAVQDVPGPAAAGTRRAPRSGVRSPARDPGRPPFESVQSRTHPAAIPPCGRQTHRHRALTTGTSPTPRHGGHGPGRTAGMRIAITAGHRQRRHRAARRLAAERTSR